MFFIICTYYLRLRTSTSSWTILNFYVPWKTSSLEISYVGQSYSSVEHALIQSCRTNYNLHFTGVGHNVRWFPPYAGQSREWVGKTSTFISLMSDRMSRGFLPASENFVNGRTKCITSISLVSDRMSGGFLSTTDNFVNGSDKLEPQFHWRRTEYPVVSPLRRTISWMGRTNYNLHFTRVGQNVRWFPPYTSDNFVNGSNKL